MIFHSYMIWLGIVPSSHIQLYVNLPIYHFFGKMGAKLKNNTYVTYVDSGKKCIYWFCVCVQWYLVNHRLLGPFIQSLPMILPVKATWSYHDPSWSIQLTWYVWDKSCHLKIAYRTHFHSFSSWLALIFGDWLPACSSYPMGPSLQQARSPRFFAAPGNKKNSGAYGVCQPGKVLRFRSTVASTILLIYGHMVNNMVINMVNIWGLQASNHHRIITTSSSISSKARTPVLDCVSQCAAVQCDCSKKEVRIRSWSTKFHTATVQ